MENVLRKYDLPTGIEKSTDELMPYIMHDKKSAGDTISIVRVNEIGSFYFERLSFDKIRELIAKESELL